MKIPKLLESSIVYGWELLRSAVEGARSSGQEVDPRSVLLSSARTSLATSVAVASLGVAAGYLLSRRKAQKLAGFGVLGAAVGLVGGIVWGTRRMTGGMARGALRRVGDARNAHWLAKHPVDYA